MLTVIANCLRHIVRSDDGLQTDGFTIIAALIVLTTAVAVLIIGVCMTLQFDTVQTTMGP